MTSPEDATESSERPEDRFWKALAFQINRVGSSRSDGDQLPGWCDWFQPRSYHLGGESSTVRGKVGFVNRREATQLEFTVTLPSQVASAGKIAWDQLLRGLGDRIRMSIDLADGHMAIDVLAS